METRRNEQIAQQEQRRALIQDVMDETFEIFDVDTMADYDADFSGDQPYFLNIWTKETGKGYGYLVFHDFLRRVGQGKTFLSTDMTGPGAHLFEKAAKDGLIEKIQDARGVARNTTWKVIGDPIAHLQSMQ